MRTRTSSSMPIPFATARSLRRPVTTLLPLSAIVAVAMVSCGGPAPGEAGTQGEKTVITAPEQQGVVQFDSLAATNVSGTYDYHGVTLHFDSEARDGVDYVTLELRSMKLTAVYDGQGIFDLDGFNTQTGGDTAMTEVDKTVIHTFEVALTDIYREWSNELHALDALNRMVTVWGDYPASLPLQHTFYGREERIVGLSLCNLVNKPGFGNSKVYRAGSHDCLHIKNVFSDCAAITAGCMYGDDSSTVSNIFMSMHPGGTGADGTFFGTTANNYRCYEPDHDANVEFAYGLCYGRCGSGCGGGTQFTQACLDHDTCVRFGHVDVAPDCDDDFLDAAVDFGIAPNCGGVNFRVDFNWSGLSQQSNCPAVWNNTNDGCDVGCQFTDGDCFRSDHAI